MLFLFFKHFSDNFSLYLSKKENILKNHKDQRSLLDNQNFYQLQRKEVCIVAKTTFDSQRTSQIFVFLCMCGDKYNNDSIKWNNLFL